jgi:hypothetical protein
MKFMLLIYIDHALISALPQAEYDSMMRDCLQHADELRASGVLLDAQQLELPPTARALRVRDQRARIVDGPFAETKEYLGGFNLIEAPDHDEAVRIAGEFPWTRIGCVEVRPVRDMDQVRVQVGA